VSLLLQGIRSFLHKRDRSSDILKLVGYLAQSRSFKTWCKKTERSSNIHALHFFAYCKDWGTTRAGLEPIQPMRLHWAPRLRGPRAMVFG